MDMRIVAVILLAGIVIGGTGFFVLFNHEPEEQELRFDVSPGTSADPVRVVSNGTYYKMVFSGDAEFVKWIVSNGEDELITYESSPVLELSEGTYDIRCIAYSDAFADTMETVLVVEDGSDIGTFLDRYSLESTLMTVSSILIILATVLLEGRRCR